MPLGWHLDFAPSFFLSPSSFACGPPNIFGGQQAWESAMNQSCSTQWCKEDVNHNNGHTDDQFSRVKHTFNHNTLVRAES